jgi:nicotinate-nucleotide pyrophosphorylase (carboxylating)
MSGPVALPHPRIWGALVSLAIEEDVGSGDATSVLVIGSDAVGQAVIEAREPLVTCGLPVAEAVAHAIDSDLRFDALLSGSLRSILMAERTALNFLMRLCGVATYTRRFVDAVAGTSCQIVDTRKTLPGWRILDKYATAVGGARNHRVGLSDGILLKDNHIAAAGGVEPAVKSALAGAPANLRVQVEVESVADAQLAIEAGADFLLLDNWSPEDMARAIPELREHALLEASGGIHLDNVRDYAETGIARISIGALTHSAVAADVALEIAQEDHHSGGATG